MPIAKFIGYWSKDWQKKHNVPKGFLIIKPKESYVKDLGLSLKKLTEHQKKKDTLRELNFTIEYHYKKRTLNMNNLMWALYEIEANEMNANTPGHKNQLVTPEELYMDDINLYAPRIEARIQEEKMPLLKRLYKYYEIREQVGGLIILDIILGTSQFDTKQMAYWIDRQFNRLAYNNVTFDASVEIKDYWRKWRQELNDKKIILFDKIATQEEYKEAHIICEATGEDARDGKGMLAHINARGMGGNAEPEKNYSSNWLCLLYEPHNEVQHQKGWGEFLRKYPHLKYKVEAALKREYDVLPEWKGNELDIF